MSCIKIEAHSCHLDLKEEVDFFARDVAHCKDQPTLVMWATP